MTNETTTTTENAADASRVLTNNAPTNAESKANARAVLDAAIKVNKAAKAAKTNAPTQPRALSAKDASDPRKVAAFIKAMREYNDALKASQPRGTKQPVKSDAAKLAFFRAPTISNEDVEKKTGVKLVTVRTFRQDAVNTFKNAMACGMLSPAGKKWYEANKRK